MAKQSRTDELFEMLRARGLRTRVARALSDAADAGRSGAATSQKAAQGIIDDLRKLADELEGRIRGGGDAPAKRSAAAKKAATTRKAKANARSGAAKKAAATRKRTASKPTATRKSTSSGTRKSTSSGTRKSTSSGTRKTASTGTRRRTTSSRTKKS